MAMALPVIGIQLHSAGPLTTKVDVNWHPSPNFGPRRGEAAPDLIVLHYTAMATTADSLERLCAPEHEVSAHYLICPNGQIHQMVKEEHRAWHAGAGCWGGCTDVNSASIGVELCNNGQTPFSAPQMAALEQLLAAIMGRWNIPPHRVIGHSDMAPDRKGDPGERFDWRRLAMSGLSVWPKGSGQGDNSRFFQDAIRFGYNPDQEAETLLNAFRLRCRPWATGQLTPTDAALIQDLAERFPVDQNQSST